MLAAGWLRQSAIGFYGTNATPITVTATMLGHHLANKALSPIFFFPINQQTYKLGNWWRS
jgi:hypothetical protein